MARFGLKIRRSSEIGFRRVLVFRFSLLFEHDLFRKPVSTFRDHASTQAQLFCLMVMGLVEPGVEPLTSSLRTRRSPN